MKPEGMMKRSILAVAILGWLSLAGNAVALERWDFGRLAYGSHVKTAPVWAADYACNEEGACTFTDALGVYYLTWDEYVVIKRFEVIQGKDHPMPFGIDYSRDVHAILQKIERQTGKKFECIRHEEAKNIEPGTMFCSATALEGDPGVSLHVTFDENGKLRQIELWTHYI